MWVLDMDDRLKNIDKRLKTEITLVKNLGEKIGYGNLMSLASALWRKKLVDDGYPKELVESSVFVPVSIDYVKDEWIDEVKDSASILDNYINYFEEFIK